MAEIRTVAVIGAGMLGGNIAELAALGGYRTILEDILPASLRRAQTSIRSNLEQAVKRGVISKLTADTALARMEFASTVEGAAREANLVIEAVPDEMESKIEIFTLLDKICKPQTILVACNSSCLTVTEVASVTYRPAKIVGITFPITNHNIKRIEVIRAPETDEETTAACMEFGERMGLDLTLIDEAKHGPLEQANG